MFDEVDPVDHGQVSHDQLKKKSMCKIHIQTIFGTIERQILKAFEKVYIMIYFYLA